MNLFECDDEKREKHGIICGVDEAGRGPLAGNVYAAAVILPQGVVIDGLDDSKKLSEKKREKLYDEIIRKAEAYYIAYAIVEEIEELNILNAALLAMKRAVEGLKRQPDFALIDGDRKPNLDISCEAVIKGDGRFACIAAASILAKVARDREMLRLAEIYPEYGFEKHKGYGTKLHYQALGEHGACPVHRMSFLKKTVADKKQKGDYGENKACLYLEKNGYNIIARNFRLKTGEIDIIAENSERLAFVEVKTRKLFGLGRPSDAVNYDKRRKIVKTAQVYLMKRKTEKLVGFDIIEVIITDSTAPETLEINHFEDAFDASGERFLLV